MRSVIVIAAVASIAASVAGCGAPSVDLPPGNNQTTSQAPPGELPAPSVQPVPARYPFARLALHGAGPNAVRVLVEGAGNPASADVQPMDGSFCIDVVLAAAPAHYTLTVRTQAGDGRLSAPTTVEVDRANDAPPPADAVLCDGSHAGA